MYKTHNQKNMKECDKRKSNKSSKMRVIVAFAMRWERRKLQKMENQQLLSLSRQCSSTPVGFDKGFLTKNNNVTTLQHPPYWPVSAVPSTAIGAVLCYWQHYATDIITNAKKELKRLSQNGFQERFQHLHGQKCTDARRVSFWTKGSFTDCTVLYFSDIKCFREHPAATVDNTN